MNVVLIAQNTFREAIRDRVLAGLVIAGFVLLAFTQVAGSLAMGEGVRLTVDLGLSSITVLGLLGVLMVGTSLVAKEIERRTIFNLLSRPLPRPAYLIGKWLGLSSALWAVALALGGGLWMLVTALGHAGHALALVEAVYMAGLELTLVTAVAVLFSALSTPVLSSLYTLGAFLAGQWCDDLRAFSAKAPEPLHSMLGAVANVVPNLTLFNMRALASVGEVTTPAHLALATLYAMLYCGCILALASAAFESRDFK